VFGHITHKENRLSKPQRCYAFTDRILDIARDEFADLSPPEVIFALGLLQWRYHEYLEVMARQPAQTPAPAPSPTEVN
jgi:hypothetical protein